MNFPTRFYIVITESNGAWSPCEYATHWSIVEMLDEVSIPPSHWLKADGTPERLKVLLIDMADPCGVSDQTLASVKAWAKDYMDNLGHWPTELAHICPDDTWLDPEALADWSADHKHEARKW